ncbi:MAG TPA: biotin/lipoyl-containing protein [Thermoanaerobaculia bacterium]
MKFIARHAGQEFPVEVERHSGGYRVRLDERWLIADLVNAGPYLRSLRLEDGTQLSLIHDREGTTHQISLDDSIILVELTDPLSLKRKGREDELGAGGTIRAMMPGRIVRVMVNKGDTVRKGASLLVLEAMKMENEIQAPADGVVDQVLVETGQTVESGAELVHIAPLER